MRSSPSDNESSSDAKLLLAVALTRGDAEELMIRRRRCGKGFVYLDEDGGRIRDREVLDRIRSLAIPPNYDDVRIAADPDAHLQAIGRDEAGRTQYRYHPKWEVVRERQKIDRLSAISHAIGRIRRRIGRDIRRPLGSREKTLATLVMLLDRSHIRIGCEGYVHSGRSRGAATLLKRNIEVTGDTVRLGFRGKGGRELEHFLRAPVLAEAITDLQSVPGRRMFQYRDPAGSIRAVTAADVNAYLNDVAGAAVTAKDFRTLVANAEAARRLGALKPGTTSVSRRRQVAAVCREVAALLGNTPAVVRKSYVHGELVKAFEEERLFRLCARTKPRANLRRGEEVVAALFGQLD